MQNYNLTYTSLAVAEVESATGVLVKVTDSMASVDNVVLPVTVIRGLNDRSLIPQTLDHRLCI